MQTTFSNQSVPLGQTSINTTRWVKVLPSHVSSKTDFTLPINYSDRLTIRMPML